MSATPQSIDLTSYVAGTPVASSERLEVRNPYNNQRVGSVTLATRVQTESAIQAGLQGGTALTRYQRSAILDRAATVGGTSRGIRATHHGRVGIVHPRDPI